MKMKRFDTQINVSLHSDFRKELEEAAASIGLSMAEFARLAMEEKLKRMLKERKA